MKNNNAHQVISRHTVDVSTDRNLSFQKLCLPVDLSVNAIDQFNNIIQPLSSVPLGTHLYRTGDEFLSLIAISSGSIKTYMIDDDGIEQVTGFYLPGEILGFEGLGTTDTACNIVTLETSTVCEIPIKPLVEIAHKHLLLQHYLFQKMSQELGKDTSLLRILRHKNAALKIAIFLVDLTTRYSHGTTRQNILHLPMTRIDIANYLGLTIETVSRTFSSFQREKIISVNGRKIEIKQFEKLETLYHKYSL